MQIKESLDNLVSFLASTNLSEMREYFPHIAEALEIDVTKVANTHRSMSKAIRDAVQRVDESDIPAVVNEIRNFFEETDNDEDDDDDMEEAYHGKKKKMKEMEDDEDDDMEEAYHGKKKKMKEMEDDEDDDDDMQENIKNFGDKKAKPFKKGHKKEEMEDDEDDEQHDEMYEKKKKKMHKESYHITSNDIDISEDADVVFSGESLTEDFQRKAQTIFESAVVRKVNEKLDEIVEEYDDLFEEKIEEIQEDLTEQVDQYLSYVIEEWSKENEIAIESGIRTEMTESFLNNLKQVFEDHYVDLPEDDVPLVEDLQKKIEELEDGLNESLNENAVLSKQLRESRNDDIFETIAEGLTEMQKEKFRKLTEGISFDEDNETYSEKLSIIKENYFSGRPSRVLTEDYDDDEYIEDTTESLSGPMKSYAESLSRLGLGKK